MHKIIMTFFAKSLRMAGKHIFIIITVSLVEMILVFLQIYMKINKNVFLSSQITISNHISNLTTLSQARFSSVRDTTQLMPGWLRNKLQLAK